MYRRHSFNLQPLLHNHHSYWHASKTPRLSILVGFHAGEIRGRKSSACAWVAYRYFHAYSLPYTNATKGQSKSMRPVYRTIDRSRKVNSSPTNTVDTLSLWRCPDYNKRLQCNNYTISIYKNQTISLKFRSCPRVEQQLPESVDP